MASEKQVNENCRIHFAGMFTKNNITIPDDYLFSPNCVLDKCTDFVCGNKMSISIKKSIHMFR